jgi:hypothetical protein
MHSPLGAAPTQPHPYVNRTAFRGQDAGETVVLLQRGALVALLLPGWPWLAGLTCLGGTLLWQARGGLPQSVAITLMVPIALATLVALLHWAVTHALPWWFRLSIITNQRIILSQGYFRPQFEQFPLRAVQAVEVVRPNLMETLLGYGNIRVASGGGDAILFPGLAHASAFAEAITTTQRAHAPAAPTGPAVADATLQGMLDRLGQGTAPPTMPPLDRRLTFNWPLRRAFAVKLPADETVLGIVSRHWWVLVNHLAAPLALLAAAGLAWLLGAWSHATTWPLALALGISSMLWSLLMYLNFADDTFVFTTRRILTVQRRYFILASDSEFITYDKIQESKLSTPSFFAKFVGFGTVQLNVGGNSPPLIMDMVPHPDLINKAIQHNSELAQKRAEVATANRERGEIKDWFAEVLAEMVVTTPELRGQTLEDALVQTYAEGMRLVVLGDTVAMPGYPPGIVVSQSPSAGSRALRGGDISVLLTRS